MLIAFQLFLLFCSILHDFIALHTLIYIPGGFFGGALWVP